MCIPCDEWHRKNIDYWIVWNRSIFIQHVISKHLFHCCFVNKNYTLTLNKHCAYHIMWIYCCHLNNLTQFHFLCLFVCFFYQKENIYIIWFRCKLNWDILDILYAITHFILRIWSVNSLRCCCQNNWKL